MCSQPCLPLPRGGSGRLRKAPSPPSLQVFCTHPSSSLGGGVPRDGRLALHPASLAAPPPASTALLQPPPVEQGACGTQCAVRKAGQGAEPCGQSHHWWGVLIREDLESGCLSPAPKLLPLILRRDTVPENRHISGTKSPQTQGSHCSKEQTPPKQQGTGPFQRQTVISLSFFLAMPLGLQDQTRAPTVGAWNPNHWTSRGVPNYLLALKQGPYGPPCHHVAWFQPSERKLENAVN